MIYLVAVLMLGAGDTSLLPNGGFEEVYPSHWITETWGGRGDFIYPSPGREGSHAVGIRSTDGADCAWTTELAVAPFSRYRLTGWIKTREVTPLTGKGALLNLHERSEASEALTGTRDWTEVSLEFETGDTTDPVQINCLFGGWGLAKGEAWFDDIRLERLGRKDIAMNVTIDATARKAPLNKLIYGQFIEHLGRCIYGGIWAEMLEDRKFYTAAGHDESPWHSVADPEDVWMDTAEPYVGEHTTVIELRGDGEMRGIMQAGLGVEAGMEYVGRVVLSGDGHAQTIDIALIWDDDPDARETITIENPLNQFEKIPLHFTAGATTDNAQLRITGRGDGSFKVAAVSLMPGDNVHGMRADTLALLKELDAPIYRWPCGNFVSGYNWKDGIGDRDKRPPRKNPAWQGIEHNDFGIHEFLAYCAELGTEPLIVVNSGQGDAGLAVEEMQYVVGGADTAMGQLRAENGQTEPWDVKYWGVGNEMYGDWQLGHMPLEKYTEKHNQFAIAMRDVREDIVIVGVGATGPWSETMLANCADHMDLLSEHFYCGEKEDLIAHVRQIPEAIRHKAENHRRYLATIPALKDKFIPIALDEWNYWYGPHAYGELGTRYFLKDGLGIAAGIHEFARNSDIMQMANYAQTVNVIGAIKTTKRDAAFETTGLVLKLYRREFGNVPVEVTGERGPLDVAAAWTADNSAFTIAIVNPLDDELAVPVTITGAELASKGRRWTIAGADPMAYNTPGEPMKVEFIEDEVEFIDKTLNVPAYSASVFRFGRK